jgi:hypothetical protein
MQDHWKKNGTSIKGMELTVKIVTPFARRAKRAPLLPAAHPGR